MGSTRESLRSTSTDKGRSAHQENIQRHFLRQQNNTNARENGRPITNPNYINRRSKNEVER
eukprot:11076080-Heterocapsa_arctica.AAC.1